MVPLDVWIATALCVYFAAGPLFRARVNHPEGVLPMLLAAAYVMLWTIRSFAVSDNLLLSAASTALAIVTVIAAWREIQRRPSGGARAVGQALVVALTAAVIAQNIHAPHSFGPRAPEIRV